MVNRSVLIIYSGKEPGFSTYGAEVYDQITGGLLKTTNCKHEYDAFARMDQWTKEYEMKGEKVSFMFNNQNSHEL